jgi:asparagine synthase (glutamine-hydrolysing)
MCGIAGFFNYKSGLPASETSLRSLLESIRYRGPDHLGIFSDRDIAIGNVRLSIQDASPRGNQPIYNEDRSLVVVYNGEIYNAPLLRKELEQSGHEFRTETDTEILVHLYEDKGLDMADRLNGMFAFALFDTKARNLILCRDRTGQKPLYLYENQNGLVFSSELRALLPFLENRSINPKALRNYLSLGYALEPETIVRGVSAMETGTLLSVGKYAEVKRKYWQPQFLEKPAIASQGEWEEEADVVLNRALKRHMLSDVPVTLFLSSGVDSSLLALYMNREYGVRQVYTGSFVGGADHDEYEYANALGRICGMQVERVRLDGRVLADAVESFIGEASMPSGDTSAPASYCLARETSKSYRVVLGGDGADELFGGYPTYTLPWIRKKFSWAPKGSIRLARAAAAVFAQRNGYMPLPLKFQQLANAWGESVPVAHFEIKNFLPEDLERDVLSDSFLKDCRTARPQWAQFVDHFNSLAPAELLRRLFWIDFRTFLQSGTIPKVERQCMRSSLENRLPYLDNEVIDLSLKTDVRLMVSGLKTKVCLKKLLMKKLGGRHKLNPIKQGFTPPMRSLLKNELGEWRRFWLNYSSPYFKHNLTKTFDRFEAAGWDFHRLEWSICVFNNWRHANNME